MDIGVMDDDYPLLIAERVHDKSRVGDKLARGEDIWKANPVRAVLSIPALCWGPTRARLEKMLGTDEFKARNLLWPHHQPGAWDEYWARNMALAVIDHLPKRFVVLGANVRNAFSLEYVCWGEVGITCGHEVLVLPHPSGRSRILSDDLTKFKDAFQAFVRCER